MKTMLRCTIVYIFGSGTRVRGFQLQKGEEKDNNGIGRTYRLVLSCFWFKSRFVTSFL